MFRKLNSTSPGEGSITITLDGQPVAADEGEAVAAVLLRVPPYISRTTPVMGATRAPFCMMGACFDCLVEIDGQSSKRSCMTMVRDGMVVRRQAGRPNPASDLFA